MCADTRTTAIRLDSPRKSVGTRYGLDGELIAATLTSMLIATPFHVCVTSYIPCHTLAQTNPTSCGDLSIEKPVELVIQNIAEPDAFMSV